MGGPASCPAPDPPDELAVRRAAGGVPQQRVPLTDPEREHYERRVDAYEVEAADYRAPLHDAAAQFEAAHHDGLTGTRLRHAGMRLLGQELDRAARTDSPLSIAFVDVDGLKTLNDTAGHAAGDATLVSVARALLAGLRGYDHSCAGAATSSCSSCRPRHPRCGGGPGGGRPACAARRARALQHQPRRRGAHAGETADALVARADHALYRARGRGLDV